MTVDPTGWGLSDFAAAFGRGVTPVELVERVVGALERAPAGVLIGPPCVESALGDAAALAGIDPATRPLYGVPFVVKDNIDVAGLPTTAACPGAAYAPAEDATIVALLRAAGAIVVGKANLDQFATGLVGTRSPYGIPPNVLDARLVPGGSSSGSAVAVGLGLVPFAIGTDTAGSGRVPAALNGIVGIKPTVGRISTRGILPAMRSLDCPSVFARSVEDALVAAAVMAGPGDGSARHPCPPRPVHVPLRIGVPSSWPGGSALSAEMATWYARAVDRLTALGAVVVPADIGPALALGAQLYGSALVAERAEVGGPVARGVDGLDPVVAQIIRRAGEHSAVDAFHAVHAAAAQRTVVGRLWDDIDVLALPTTPFVPSLEDVRRDPIGINEALGALTSFVNLADLACVTVPMEPGAPAGLQLIGPAWSDDDLGALATDYCRGRSPSRPPRCGVVVVGAHLEGQPLNHQLARRGAVLNRRTTTSPTYRLYSLAGTSPTKPGLVRVAAGGAAIDVELWAVAEDALGSFLLDVPPPLALGSVELADGSWWHGFVCEPIALSDATDITHTGGWRRHLATLHG